MSISVVNVTKPDIAMAGDGLDGIGAKSNSHFLVAGALPSGVVLLVES